MSETWGEAIEAVKNEIVSDIAEAFNEAMHDLWTLPSSSSHSSSSSEDQHSSSGGCVCPGRCCCH